MYSNSTFFFSPFFFPHALVCTRVASYPWNRTQTPRPDAHANSPIPIRARTHRSAPHLLAPTGSDFNKYGTNGTVLAGYHYDLNFLTIHGKSRFPGLYVWLRDGRRMPVKVPPGHLIVQAGKQIEYLTGGYIMCGFHEVGSKGATLLHFCTSALLHFCTSALLHSSPRAPIRLSTRAPTTSPLVPITTTARSL